MQSWTKKLSIVIILTFFLSGGVAFAQGSDDVKKALKDTRESVDELIEAKDENSPFDLALRIKTFKDVINLSITEAEDLKVNLLSLNIKNEKIQDWRNRIVQEINEAINYYEQQRSYINENEGSLTLQAVRDRAQEFKKWRKNNYLPVHRQVRNLILIKKEEKALKTAKERSSKIEEDLNVLSKYGILGEGSKAWEMLSSAKNMINQGEEKKEKAMEEFINSISTSSAPVATSTATSSPSIDSTSTTTDNPQATSSDENTAMTIQGTEAGTSTAGEESSATSSDFENTIPEESTSTARGGQNASIKGLVSSSLQDVREAYQVFIEMSNFVRELLM